MNIKKVKAYVDYCSAVPDFNLNSCCKQHDEDYANAIGKYTADFRFLKCGLARARSYSGTMRPALTAALITVYYIGVSLFGWGPYRRAEYG